MQYILSQEEYTALLQKQEATLRLSKAKLQQICTDVADNMPIQISWNKGMAKQPWGCIITAKREHYCDECPVRGICPNEHKHYSK